MRLFVADPGVPDGVNELTDGHEPIVRVAAPDLQQARRACARIRADDGTGDVILDVRVAVAGDFRSAQRVLGVAEGATVHYAGTVDGLAGLVADIVSAGVADGVTLIPAVPGLDVETVGRDVLRRLSRRNQPRAS